MYKSKNQGEIQQEEIPSSFEVNHHSFLRKIVDEETEKK